MFVLIDNYDSFTYNLYHYFRELNVDVEVHRNDQITVDEIIAIKPQGIILSPGPCTPDVAGICLELIDKAKEIIPIFGVCLGHQSIGQIFGGNVIRAEKVMHGKVSPIHHQSTGIFAGLPSPFNATRYHSLIVDRDTLPDCLEITAVTEDGLIMGLEHRDYNIHGVQFHPESIASDHGHALLKSFIKMC